MLVNECCNCEVISCDTETLVHDVAMLMRRHHVGSIVVTDKDVPNVPIGIVTDRDIVVEAVGPDLDAKTFTAGDIMNTPLITVGADDSLMETLQLMRIHKIRRVVVANKNGTLYGIVTADDIINLLVRELQMITTAIVGQQGMEERLRK